VSKKMMQQAFLFLWPLFLSTILAGAACQLRRTSLSSVQTSYLSLTKVVVFGFRPALREGEEPRIIRGPIAGGIFESAPVSSDTAMEMTRILLDMCASQKGYKLVSPDAAQAAYSNIVQSYEGISPNFMEILGQIGRDFGADAVLVGHIYRWRERQGTDFAVTYPASVAFDLNLIRPANGAVLWTAKFDKTQRSLCENILDIGTFLKGKGRWMTADQLGMLGLREIVKHMPPGGTEQ